MKTVLLFRTSFHPQMHLTYEPVFDFARTHDWHIQTIEYMNAAVSRYWTDSAAPKPDIRRILNMWHPDGCIVECGGIPHEPWDRAFRNVPTVFLDRPQPSHGKNSASVADDQSAVATLAAKELLSLGLDSYAFVGFHEPLPWSEERGRIFREIIRQHGKRCESIRMPKPSAQAKARTQLDDFLERLDKPCGLFAANDETAAKIINACIRLKIAVPDDMSVVSVDNDVETCEHLPVTLTSIELDHQNAVCKAAALLDALMAGKPAPSSTFGVRRIVRRASASGLRGIDSRVAKALEFIRLNACTRLSPADVVREMGCSERLANLRFSEAVRHTILDEIHLRRIESAKEQLVAKALPIATIAELCGYSSPTDFGRVFRRYTGQTPRAWKRQPPHSFST